MHRLHRRTRRAASIHVQRCTPRTPPSRARLNSAVNSCSTIQIAPEISRRDRVTGPQRSQQTSSSSSKMDPFQHGSSAPAARLPLPGPAARRSLLRGRRHHAAMDITPMKCRQVREVPVAALRNNAHSHVRERSQRSSQIRPSACSRRVGALRMLALTPNCIVPRSICDRRHVPRLAQGAGRCRRWCRRSHAHRRKKKTEKEDMPQEN